jgi:hypothetical protein
LSPGSEASYKDRGVAEEVAGSEDEDCGGRRRRRRRGFICN